MAIEHFAWRIKASSQPTLKSKDTVRTAQFGDGYKQVSLKTVPGNSAAEQEQLYRRIRGWLSPQASAD